MRSEDIAKLAGVSRSTVSRVLNNYPDIPQRTRDKVLRIIEQYHYEPNTSARALAGKGTDTIGLFVVSMDERHTGNRIYQNHYFAPIVDTVIDTANAAGFYVLVHTVYMQDDYLKIKQAFQQRRIDGGIIVGTQKDSDRIAEICRLGKPFVMIDFELDEIAEHSHNRETLSVINSDDYHGACEAMRYLIQLGHRRIAHIRGRMNTLSGRQRFLAYEAMMNEFGLPYEDSDILDGKFLKAAAYEEVYRMLSQDRERMPTAIFAANDDMALSAIQAIRDNGLSVPDDISVIGFDDIPISSQFIPSLSTVRLPIYDMSKEAVNQIVSMCTQGTKIFNSSSFPTELIIRDSCKRL
ncbi:LacI family DNA-binding transcriptional regulator [Paenibacillus xylaniclasticus]|uniref:LacI family DNA-binding transcriptional regulator n=1 Tax=Paenibacillus xylaniclasticus TaxID=588083 RepID=UPI000FD9A181|nr:MULTISPECIES: LacI family DNA-binding transcriptional regulator [Paenibacillus]GFN30756.1 LacI family transcriptional regulator [Paenibacillus curdlanolyticus]